MNLSELPDIQFIDTDPETTKNVIISGYEAIINQKLFPGDPRRLFLLSLANIIIQQRVLINLSAKQNLLRYANGDILDHHGARAETARIGEQAATTTVRFNLSAARADVVAVPPGTRVTPGGNLFFATKQSAQIASGSLFIDVLCECLVAGEIGNGYLPNQINVLVDPIAFIASVANTTVSSGGADREDDERYRERIHQAPESFSVAGPEGAYEFLAKSADSSILDVSVESPSDGVVEIRPLLVGGELPTQTILDAVVAKCNDKRARPLTDHVQVLAPTQVAYDINLTYWISTENEANVAGIQAAVNTAVADYRLWQKSKLGRDINPSELMYRIVKAGAKRAAIASPVFTALTKTQVAAESVTVTVNYGGVEDA